jgi:DNA-binding response OmpR family regulator
VSEKASHVCESIFLKAEASMAHPVPAQRLILIVDDDQWIRSAMTEMLESDGFAVVQAADGESALDLAQRFQPAAILLDLSLPTRSGLEVLRELKARNATHDIPVVVVSAYAILLRADDMRRADAMIQKPFDMGQVLLKVQQLVGRSKEACVPSDSKSQFAAETPSALTAVTWHGSADDWRRLQVAVERNCICAQRVHTPGLDCPAHALLADQRTLDRLIFVRSIASRLARDDSAPTAVADRESPAGSHRPAHF